MSSEPECSSHYFDSGPVGEWGWSPGGNSGLIWVPIALLLAGLVAVGVFVVVIVLGGTALGAPGGCGGG